MTVSPAPSARHAPRGLRFSLSGLLLVAAVTGLLLANLASRRELSELKDELAEVKRELNAQRPLAVQDVAQQFHDRLASVIDSNRAMTGLISVSVKDVRYSPTTDSYKVKFSWTGATDGRTWFADAILKSDGYGAYGGVIRNEPLTSPLGHQDGIPIVVKSPSPLAEA